MQTHKQQILSGQIVAGMSFNEKVWALTARIPEGRVATYADLAMRWGQGHTVRWGTR